VAEQEKPSIDGLMALVRAYGSLREDLALSRTKANAHACDRAWDAVEQYAERLTAGVGVPQQLKENDRG